MGAALDVMGRGKRYSLNGHLKPKLVKTEIIKLFNRSRGLNFHDQQVKSYPVAVTPHSSLLPASGSHSSTFASMVLSFHQLMSIWVVSTFSGYCGYCCCECLCTSFYMDIHFQFCWVYTEEWDG